MTSRRGGLGRTLAVLGIVACAIALAAPAWAGQAATALPAGGGEPGKAYFAMQKAMKAKDIPAIRALVSAERAKEMDKPDFKDMLGMIVEMMPPDVKVTGGTQTGDTAVLKVTGGKPGEMMNGEVTMVKEEGAWKVSQESWKM